MPSNRTLCRKAVMIAVLFLTVAVQGCRRNASDKPAATPAGGAAPSTPATLTLDWKPEPEFGGFYDAMLGGKFARHGLDLTIHPLNEGSTWQLVATGKTDFATTAADQVLIARSQNADVIAFFAVYQTCPQGIMVHQARGFHSLADVFSHDGLLLAEDITYFHFLRDKYGPIKPTVGQYSGDIAAFLHNPTTSQQCFVTSEPILAAQKGSDPQTFLVADSGYNPYTTVLICSGKTWRENPSRVNAMITACREGWLEYLADPAATNKAMSDLNTEMDLATFTAAAAAQKPLILSGGPESLGKMTSQRWQTLEDQLVRLKAIDAPVKVQDCFINP